MSQLTNRSGLGTCWRCETTWEYVEPHSTDLGNGGGIHPLCELCWAELGHPDDRLPYYQELWQKWVDQAKIPACTFSEYQDRLEHLVSDWNLIEKAVLNGG